MRLRVFAAVIALTGSLFAADPGLVSLAMPDSQVMAGVNFEQVMLSPFGQYLTTQAGQLTNNAGLPKLIETAGFDPRRDLREILISAKLVPNANEALVLARGTFDVPKILEAARASGATVDTYQGAPFVEMSKQGAMAFPDSTLVVSGDPASVRAAIDRIAAPTAIGSALAVQVNQLSTTEDAWFVETIPLSQLQPKAPGAPGANSGPTLIYGKVQQASGGVKFGANAVVNLQAVLPTEQDASAMAALLKGLPALLQMGGAKGEANQIVALLQSLNATVDGTVVKVSLSIPEQQIEQMMQMQNSHTSQAQRGSAPEPKMGTAAWQAAAPQEADTAAAQRIRVGREVQKAKLVQHTEPVYPPLALQARISGVVRLNAVIAKDGTVKKLTIESGHPLLAPAAMQAVKQWVYEPTLLNGQPAEVATQIEVNFSLAQ
jgi:TonB family protein